MKNKMIEQDIDKEQWSNKDKKILKNKMMEKNIDVRLFLINLSSIMAKNKNKQP